MLASLVWTSCVAASGRPNCSRFSTYCRALRQQSSAAPMAPQATPNRALFKHPNGPASPLAPGSRLASGTNTSSITISPVLEARRLILDRKSTRLNPVTNAHLVCRLLLEKNTINNTEIHSHTQTITHYANLPNHTTKQN